MKTEISVWDNEGKEIDRISLPFDVITPDSGRTSRIRDSQFFLKGAGVIYGGQNLYGNFNPNEYTNLAYSDEIPGISAFGMKKVYLNKKGIFLNRFQPYFRDYIGACGPKERKIVENSRMELSGVTVDEVIETRIPDYSIYKCLYKCNRNSEYPEARNLIPLIQLISEGIWHCPWDKNLYNDLDSNGNIRDVADWSRSESPNFKTAMGTMYSLIYSIFKICPEKLKDILSELGANIEPSLLAIPTLCAGLIGLFNSTLVPSTISMSINIDNYRKLYLDYILECDTCSSLDTDEFSWVKEEYRNRFLKSQNMIT